MKNDGVARRAGFAVGLLFALLCRAGVHARRGRSPLFLRSWVKGQNPSQLYKIWLLRSPDVFLYLRQYGFCPDSWPRFRGRHCGTNALRWFCLRQKTEKAAANSEARGTAQGKSRGPSAPPRFTIRQHLLRRSGLQYIQYCCALAPCICYRLASGSALQDHRLYPRSCGPLWKPRSSDGVARDGFRSSQGNGSLLQYRFFPAGTAHPGSRSETPPAFAGGPICGKRLPCPFACRPRSVRRALPCKTNIPPLTPAFPGRKTAGERFLPGGAQGSKKFPVFVTTRQQVSL